MTEEERAELRRATLRRYNNKPERIERMRRYFQENKERHGELGRKWRDENREHDNACRRAGYRKNAAERRQKSRALYHRDKCLPTKIAKGLFNGAKRRAREGDLDFTLTKEWALSQVQTGVCAVSGMQFIVGSGNHTPMSPTIYRISRSLGYTPENSRLVIWAVNNLKGVGSDETMWTVVDAMVANRAKAR